MSNNYIIKKVDELPADRSICGYRKCLITPEDFPEASISLLSISEAEEHYHKKTTEFYYILGGRGHLILNGERIPVVPNTLIMVKPGTRHRAVGKLKTLVIGVPPFDLDDQFTSDT